MIEREYMMIWMKINPKNLKEPLRNSFFLLFQRRDGSLEPEWIGDFLFFRACLTIISLYIFIPKVYPVYSHLYIFWIFYLTYIIKWLYIIIRNKNKVIGVLMFRLFWVLASSSLFFSACDISQATKKESNVFSAIAPRYKDFSGVDHKNILCANPETYRTVGRMKTVKQVQRYYAELGFTGDIPRDSPYGAAITALQGTSFTMQKEKEEAYCFHQEDTGEL